jgi:hypothetical protein
LLQTSAVLVASQKENFANLLPPGSKQREINGFAVACKEVKG